MKRYHTRRIRRRRQVVVLSLACSIGILGSEVPRIAVSAFAPDSPLQALSKSRSSALYIQRIINNNIENESRTWRQKNREHLRRPSSFELDDQPSEADLPPKRPPTKKTQPMPVTGYNAEAIAQFYDMRPFQVIWRLNAVGLPLLVWYFGLLWDKTMGIQDDTTVQRKRGQELRMHLVRSQSVALIKSGQALSLRPDIIRNKIWAEELEKLVDAVGAFPDMEAMKIMKRELSDLLPRINAADLQPIEVKNNEKKKLSRLQRFTQSDPVLNLFEFFNDNIQVASASIGQVYKARIRKGAYLEAAIGKEEAERWGGKVVAVKVQRPDVAASAALDMYLIRQAAIWLARFRGGDLPSVADQFGMQLFGELDYVREANNCERFRELYGYWEKVEAPQACESLTRKRVLVMEWVEGQKGPWEGQAGIDMVRIGLKCSVDQLMHTGLFHADPHRGNLLRTPDGRLGFIDFGMMADVSAEDRYGLIGLVIGLQNKDLTLVTENLLKLGFLKDTTQLDQLVPRLRQALNNATGGTGKASDMNFGRLQAELDEISRENVLAFATPPFFTVIIRSLTILEGMALSVNPDFRLVRGSYPYVLRQLLSTDRFETPPMALQNLLIRLLTVNGEGREIDWIRLRDFLTLAQKAASSYDPARDESNDKITISRRTIELFFRFLTSRTGLFLKKPLVHELAEAIDGMASIGEKNLLQATRGLLPALPGMGGPVNTKRMEEVNLLLETFQNALLLNNNNNSNSKGSDIDDTTTTATASAAQLRIETILEFVQEIISLVNDDRMREDAEPLLAEIRSVFRMVAVEVLEIRGSRAMRSVLRLAS